MPRRCLLFQFAFCFALCFARLLPAEEPKPATSRDVDPAHAEKMKAGLDLFKTAVRPVLIETCINCHGGEEVQSGLDLATRKGLLRGGAKGPAVITGKSADSNLVRFITHREAPHMPEGGDKLPADAIAAISRWIDLGAPYDAPLVENPRDPDSWTATVVPPEARKFWAYQPLGHAQPPAVKNTGWVQNEIDRFILAPLEAKGLTPNDVTSRRTLIRRAYFDLIGLPPTPEEVQAFVDDSDPQAYNRLLDRLLDNPHHGERWARHWLDTARFAESHGFEQDYDRPHAYHYRDFVIRALNEDMPYDQFVRWQLAGDEIAPESPLAMMATGFLGAGVFPTQITANEVERTRYDALDDMAATAGTAFLGLSIGCARCHDHKFDPIPQADYYRFASIFTTTVRSNVEINLDPGLYRAAKAAWDKEHAPLVARLARYEREELPSRLAAWEQSPAANDYRQSSWVLLDVLDMKSAGGATLTKQPDGSILAGGKLADFDSYTFTARIELPGITGVRLEALADDSLPKHGPGRAANGNFALSDFRVTAKSGAESQVRQVKLVDPQATFEQKGLSIKFALDDDKKSAWAVDPQFGNDHAAVFATAEYFKLDGASTFSFTLKFDNNKQHAIGRVRLAVTSAALPLSIEGRNISQQALAALQTPREKRTAEQTTALLQWYRTIDADWQKLNTPVRAHWKKEPQPTLTQVMVCSEGVTPIRHHTQGADFFTETYFLKRGDTDQKMGLAAPGFPQVLTTAPNGEQHWQLQPPPGAKTSYRRRALANWITDTEYGAGHLLARVIVNRVWQHHFGVGLVATPNDFGMQGAPPTHPELLDYLAGELIQSGWQLKPLHKLLMTSSTYRQSTAYDAANAKVDPENVYHWRRSPRRLEAEIVRDHMLAVSQTLDPTMFGPGSLDESHRRRSIYFTIKRSKLIPMLQLFDQPEPLVSVGGRPSTTIAPQALLFMNNPQVRLYAHNFARRLLPALGESPEAAVTQGYQIAIGRPPAAGELQDAVAFLAAQQASYSAAADKKDQARELALADFCQVLFGLNEFVYVE